MNKKPYFSSDQNKSGDLKLNRRAVMAGTTAAALGVMLPSGLMAQTKASFCLEIKNLQLGPTKIPHTDGEKNGVRDLSGAFLVAPYGAISWYFSNLAVAFSAPHLTPKEVNEVIIPYLDCFLRNLEATGNILDYAFSGYSGPTTPTAWERPYRDRDSDDSYAATFLMAAWQSLSVLNNGSRSDREFARYWWDVNKSTIYMIAKRNLVDQIKSNGLTSVFRQDLPVPPIAGDRDTASIGYLMDNVEVHLGLRCLIKLIRKMSPSDDFGKLVNAVNTIQRGIGSLFTYRPRLYRPSDAHIMPRNGKFPFYPWVTAQIFPGAMEFPGADRKSVHLWRFIVNKSPDWSYWPGDNAHPAADAYPWAMMSYAARKAASVVARSDRKLARKMRQEANRHISNIHGNLHTQRPYVTINELGWAFAAENL